MGFLTAGVPLGVTFSFLVSAPMVNEVALVLLFGLFGWKVAGLYMGTGLFIALVTGFVISRLRMEKHLEDWVLELISAHLRPHNLQWKKILWAGMTVCDSESMRSRRSY